MCEQCLNTSCLLWLLICKFKPLISQVLFPGHSGSLSHFITVNPQAVALSDFRPNLPYEHATEAGKAEKGTGHTFSLQWDP